MKLIRSVLSLLIGPLMVLALIAVVAFFFRFYDLAIKPPHHDEGVNGFFVNEIWRRGFYAYDPRNYHGPLLFYFFQLAEKIFGFSVHSFRLVTAFFSFCSVLFVMSYRFTSLTSRSLIALMIAVSPGMIFFGRSAIHEPVFVFCQIVWIASFIRLRDSFENKDLTLFVTSFFGCMLLKETFVIPAAAFLLAWGWVEFSDKFYSKYERSVDSLPVFRLRKLSFDHFTNVMVACLLAWLVLFSGFFQNPRGLTDFWVALVPWLKTGFGGSGHDKPFIYWLNLFWRYEWFALVGVLVSILGVAAKSWKIRFISLFSLINLLVFSVIPYKTPWCVISLLWPLFFAIGFWFEYPQRRPLLKKPVVVFAIVACVVFGSGHALWRSIKVNFIDFSSPREPYVYVQTRDDVNWFAQILQKKVTGNPIMANMKIQVGLKDCWPLPWLLSRYPNVSYVGGNYEKDADLILTELTAKLDEAFIGDIFWAKRLELRDSRAPFMAYFKKSTFAELENVRLDTELTTSRSR